MSYTLAHMNKQFIPREAGRVSALSRPTQLGRDSASLPGGYRGEMELRLWGRGPEPGLGGASKEKTVRISLSSDQAGSS